MIILILISASIFQILNFNNLKNSIGVFNEGKIHNSTPVPNTRQWILNGDFSSSDNWTSAKGLLGDPDDCGASISGGQGNLEVIGKTGRKEISDPINIANSGNWTPFNKTEPAINPDTYSIENNGFYVSHSWHDDTADQFASIYWRFNVSMDVDMSDFVIKSAFLNATMYANVDWNIDTPNDVDARSGAPINQPGIFDHAFFIVEIADMGVTNTYRIAYNQTNKLGQDLPTTFYTIDTKTIEQAGEEEDLIYYLNRVFENDPGHNNFTIIVGIEISCEDDYTGTDFDDWNELRIQSLNLTFTYEKKIDQQTSVSWNQEGDKPSDIIGNPFVIDEAILNFKYKTNDTWPKASSLNSELQVLINNIPHSETIKLWTAETTFQNASINGFDVTRLIDKDKDINVSIQLYIADQFELNRTITFSIDDIYLNVTYTEDVADIETRLQLFLNSIDKTDNPVIKLPLGVNLNITVKYTNLTSEHIPGALVQLEGKVSGTLAPDPSFEQYNITINTSDLGIGVKILTIIAQKSLYETNQTQFFVEVTERETELLLRLNDNPVNDDETFKAKVDETVNITVYFQDNETHQHLPDATVTLLRWDKLNETYNQYYNITINTNDLNLGINGFTIFAQLVNYTTNSINFFIEVFERATRYELFLNNIDLTLNPFISLKIFETLNITVKYKDNETGNHIINASLQYIGGGLTGNLTEYETFEFYSEKINTTELGIGVSILNVIAQKTLYETQNIQFFVEVTKRDTELSLFLNGDPKNDGDKIILEVDETINVTVYYRDNVTKEHLPNATVTLLGFDDLDEMASYYNITINTNDLDQGITILTIFAQLDNYQSKTIQFLVEIIERDTELILFLNGLQKDDGDTIEVEIDDFINITVYYRDNKTKIHLSNASVELVGRGKLDEPDGYYNITINALDLEQGITILTIFAQLANYQPQSIQFFIKVIERSTNMQLFINNEDKTHDPTFSLTIGQILNLTVKYTDNQTGNHINTAILQLIGKGILINLTRDDILGQHYILLATTDLGTGFKSFSILAQATNFQIKTIDPIITVNSIRTLINISSQINAEPGDDVLLRVTLNDLDFGGTILNATVTYAWAYGQGELLNLYNNGTYAETLENIPEGSYTITINAFAGPNYDFESKDILLIVEAPEVAAGPDLSWLIYILIGAIIGLVVIFTLYQTHFKYPPMVRKIRKLKKKVRKDKKSKSLLVNTREEIIHNNLHDRINILTIESIQPEKDVIIEKTPIKKEDEV